MLAACLTAAGQQPAPTKPASPPTMASMVEAQLGMVERQFVVAEVRQVATADFVISSAILGQDPPPSVTVEDAANGPDNLQTKQQILQYLKDSFAVGHKAMATLNNGNALAPLDNKLPIAIPSLNTLLALAIFSFSHASDHSGQMVKYLGMNGFVPPASVGQPPANPLAK